MKKMANINIFPLLVILLILSGCKAGNPETYKEMDLYSESFADSTAIGSDFETDSLSEASLQAFEARALQKLQDVVDLIQILSNEKNDRTFREQAREMLLENFDHPGNTICIPLPDSNPLRLTVSQFADSLLANKFSSLELKIRKSSFHEPLKPLNDKEYAGSVGFLLDIKSNNKSLYPKDMSIHVILKKKPKDFGGISRDVWEVFLGDVKY